jgi:hypothetical protein
MFYFYSAFWHEMWSRTTLVLACIAARSCHGAPDWAEVAPIEFTDDNFDSHFDATSKASSNVWAVWAENSDYAGYYGRTRQMPPYTMMHLAHAIATLEGITLAKVRGWHSLH